MQIAIFMALSKAFRKSIYQKQNDTKENRSFKTNLTRNSKAKFRGKIQPIGFENEELDIRIKGL